MFVHMLNLTAQEAFQILCSVLSFILFPCLKPRTETSHMSEHTWAGWKSAGWAGSDPEIGKPKCTGQKWLWIPLPPLKSDTWVRDQDGHLCSCILANGLLSWCCVPLAVVSQNKAVLAVFLVEEEIQVWVQVTQRDSKACKRVIFSGSLGQAFWGLSSPGWMQQDEAAK